MTDQEALAFPPSRLDLKPRTEPYADTQPGKGGPRLSVELGVLPVETRCVKEPQPNEALTAL